MVGAMDAGEDDPRTTETGAPGLAGLQRLADGDSGLKPRSQATLEQQRRDRADRLRIAFAAMLAPALGPLIYLAGMVFVSGYLYGPGRRMDSAHWDKFWETKAMAPALYLAALVFCLAVAGFAALTKSWHIRGLVLLGAGAGALAGIGLDFLLSPPDSEPAVTALTRLAFLAAAAALCGAVQMAVFGLASGVGKVGLAPAPDLRR